MRRIGADATTMKTRLRRREPSGGGVCRAEHNGKKCQKLWRGEVLPLDGSLLMGDFSVVVFRPNFTLVSEQRPMKVRKNQCLVSLLSSHDIPCGATNQGTPHGVWGADAFAVP